MKVIELTYPHNYNKSDFPKIVAAIGFFDGIHLGHQTVIRYAIEKAKSLGEKSAVVTFDPHPSVVLSKEEKTVNYITPRQEKMRILQELGLDYVFIVTFNKELSELSPEKFLKHFIQDLHIVHLTGGFDFTFGKKGIATMQAIHEYLSEPLETKVIEKVTLENEKVSSTRVRKLLKKGQVKKANQLLGRYLRVQGKVIPGHKRGRTIGFPTANLSLVEPDTLLPKKGVYAVSVFIHDRLYFGVANLGYNPTFLNEEDYLKFEVYLLDFNEDIYGETVTVRWHEYIRDEKKFSSVDDLINQIHEDVRFAKNFFELNPIKT